jgi:hypothetical protein
MIDLGPPKNRLLDETEFRAGRAVANLRDQIQRIAGRDFFGRSVVEVLWEAGQITLVREKVERTER